MNGIRRLEKRYRKLEKRYREVKRRFLKRKQIKKRVENKLVLVIVTILGLYSIFRFRSHIAIELGVLSVIGMLVHETEGTRRGWWKYNTGSVYMIAGRVPLSLVFTYFFFSVLMITYVMIRVGAVP